MMKILTICIPTYKRHATLHRCIDSIVSQIEVFGLSDSVGIYVANDASPDETVLLLESYTHLNYFCSITRANNLGMNKNIKNMLQEVKLQSRYQLLLTDDDFLQPEILSEIVRFLYRFQSEHNDIPAIWTPRYSYVENGELLCVVCNPKTCDFQVEASVFNAARYMPNGFVLSGLIVQAYLIDYAYWNSYEENAYFPMIFFGHFLLEKGAYYWNHNIVHHTVLNECPWERWGSNDIEINVRLFADYVNGFDTLIKKTKSAAGTVVFFWGALPNVYDVVNGPLLSRDLFENKALVLAVIDKFHKQGILKFAAWLRMQLFFTTLLGTGISAGKALMLAMFSLFVLEKGSRKQYRERAIMRWNKTKSLQVMLKFAFL